MPPVELLACQTSPALNGKKMLTGTMVAWGTNWAITPATGVPWPSTELARTFVSPARHHRRCRRRSAAGRRRGRRVHVAQAAGEEVVARRDPAPERRRIGVDAGVDDRDGAVLAVVGHAQRAQVVQARPACRSSSRPGRPSS